MFSRKKIEKIRNVKKTSRLRKISWQWNFSYKKMLHITILSITGMSIAILGYIIFASDQFRILSIRFDEQSVKSLQNISLYEYIHSGYLHQNYSKERLYDSHKQDILKKFPYIQDIKLSRQGNNTIFIHLTFSQPHVIFQLHDKSMIGSYKESFFEIETYDEILSGQKMLQLPEYIQSGHIGGIYSRLSEEKLMIAISLIEEVIPPEQILYYTFVPGNSLLLLGMEGGQELLISLLKDINPQLIKRLDIKQFYSDYKQYKYFDLANMEHSIAR